MKSLFRLASCLVACLFASSAQADVIFSIDMDITQAGIQNTRNATSGQSFQAALVLQLNGGSRINAFSVGVDFDNTELNATDVDFSGRPAGFEQVNDKTTLNTSYSINNTTGRVRPFDAVTFANAIESNTTTIIGLITFSVLNPNADTGDVLAAQQVIGVDDILDANTLLPIAAPIIFNPGSITAVPEPTTWLFGTVLVGIGAGRIRKRFARKTLPA